MALVAAAADAPNDAAQQVEARTAGAPGKLPAMAGLYLNGLAFHLDLPPLAAGVQFRQTRWWATAEASHVSLPLHCSGRARR